MMPRKLIAVDLAGIAVTFGLAWLVYDAPLLFEEATWEPYPLLLGGLVVWVLAARAYGLYAQGAGAGRASLLDDFVGVAGLMTVGAWAIVVASWLSGKPDPDIRQLFVFWLLAVVALTGARQLARVGGGAGPLLKRPPPLWPQGRLRPPTRALAIGDCATLFVVFTVCRRLVQEPYPVDSNAWSWVLVALSLPLWVAAATAFGHYDRERMSAARDLAGVGLLASCGAWFLIVLSPYTGEIDPDIPNMLTVWAVTIAAVSLVRRALSARAAGSARRARAPLRTPSGRT